jgi:hypothetical protein
VVSSNTRQRPIATRRHVHRLLRRHLLPLAAMALAADESASRLSNAMLVNSQRRRYEPKIRGTMVAALWGEGTREWVGRARPPAVHVHAPYEWTELVIRSLHLRIQRDTTRPLNQRRRNRREQQPDPMLPLTFRDGTMPRVTNVDMVADLDHEGRIKAIRVVAPQGKSFAWPAIEVDLSAARRLLASWQRRGVPWLATTARFAELASFDDLKQLLGATPMSWEPGAPASAAVLGAVDSQQQRPRFDVPPREGTEHADGEGEADDGVASVS